MDGAEAETSDQAVLALENWEQPPGREPGPAAAPILAVDGFEGPLDWLLELARTRRIDLARLSIAALVDAFAEALTAALAIPDVQPALLGRWGDWLVMAADLTLLRSRLLVPANAAEADAARDAAERFRQRLLNRAELTHAADWLAARDQLGRDVFARGRADAAGAVRAARSGDVTALLRACLTAIRLTAATALYRVPGPPFWSVADAAQRIRAMLEGVGEAGAALEAFLPDVRPDAPERDLRCRAAVAGTFLAGLELARDGTATLAQPEAWRSIQIGRSQVPGSAAQGGM